MTDTSVMQNFGEKLKQRTKLIPMQRLASPEEVAKQVIWLASEENTFVTNQVISISGGEWNGKYAGHFLQNYFKDMN